MQKKIRILILEDNSSDAELIKRQLRKAGLDFTAETAADKNSFVAALDEFVPDLILADYAIPEFDGLAALNLARRRIADIPGIIVSGAIGEDLAVDTLKAGATDYVLKDRLTRLGPAVRRAIQEAEQLAEKKIAQEELGVELARTALLLEAAAALAASVELPQILESLAEITVRATGRGRVVIYAVNIRKGEVRVVVARGEPAFPVGAMFKLDEIATGLQQCVRDKKTVVFDYEASDMLPRDRTQGQAGNTKLILFIPVVRLISEEEEEEEALVIAVDEPGARREFTSRKIDLAKAAASQATVAIDRARFYAEERRSKKFSEALSEINTALTSVLDVGEVLAQVIERAAGAMKCDAAGILLREDDHMVFRYLHGLPKNLVGTPIEERKMPHLLEAAVTRKPIIIRDARREGLSAELIAKFGLNTAIAVPLAVKNRLLGIIGFNYVTVADLSDARVDFVEKLAATLSIALENSRLYAETRHVADTLQESLIKMPAEISGLEFGHRYHSATEVARVGGDFYDIFELEHGHIGILIGDVSGKGLEAAGHTALVKSTIRAFAYQKFAPSSILRLTNDLLVKRAGRFFVTLFYGRLNLQNDVLHFANAGHPPPILRPRAGAARLLDEGGGGGEPCRSASWRDKALKTKIAL